MSKNIVPREKNVEKTTLGRVMLAPSKTSVRREYRCTFMQPGLVKRADGEDSTWLIPAEVIKKAASLFNGISCYLDHPDLFGFGWHQTPEVKNLVGVTFDTHWSEEENALVGNVRLYDEQAGSPGEFIGILMDQILADEEEGKEIPQIGLSTVSYQDSRLDKESGLQITTKIRHAESVDFVYSPGAGGYVRAALSAIETKRTGIGAAPLEPQGGSKMPDKQVDQKGADEKEAQPNRETLDALDTLNKRIEEISAQITTINTPSEETSPPEEEETSTRLNALSKAVEHLTAIVATEENPVEDMGETHLRGGLTGLDQVEAALEAMLTGVRPPDNIRPLTGIRELYHLLSGDFAMTGLFDKDHVYLANVDSSTMAKLTADVLNKRVVNEFQVYPRWWEPIVTPEDFASLQDVKWITLGGVGELPTVKEGQAYTEMTWDDLEQKDSFIKKGGYLGLTLEAIDKDDTRRLQSAPRALAQAAWLTLSKSISAIFTANSGVGPSIYYDDSNQRALFHASNGNLGTSALSWTSYVATRLAMKKQAEHNSAERLGALTAPRYLLVPMDLGITGLQILASEGEPGTGDNDENPLAEGNDHNARMRAAQRRVIEVPLWTDTNNWAAVADPRLYPTIGLAFRYGRTPEIFSVASPTAGLMFTNDTMPIKVRFFFATGPMDWRGLYKHNVS